MATFASRTLLSGSGLAASWRHLLDPSPLKCWGPRFVGVSLTGANRGAVSPPFRQRFGTRPVVEHEFSWSHLGWVVSHSPGVSGSACIVFQGNSSRCTETADFSSLSLPVGVKSQLSVAAPLRSPVLTGSLSRWCPRTGLAVPAPWLAPSPFPVLALLSVAPSRCHRGHRTTSAFSPPRFLYGDTVHSSKQAASQSSS